MPELEVAFRELERGMARHHCPECHSDEPGPHPMAFASSAFELRHNIVVVLEANVMPAADRDGSVGIADETERLSLLARARAFEAAGDAALTRDIEP